MRTTRVRAGMTSAVRPVVAAALAVSVAAGCGGGDDDDVADDGPIDTAAYVLANEVYTGDSSTTYINVLDSLDVSEVDYDDALEFNGGRAFIGSVGGWLFVAGPESPSILRFSIEGDGSLVQDAELSFANYGFEAVIMDEWGNTFISPTKAYYFSPDDGVTIVWNPTTMEITGEIEPIESLVRENVTLNYTPGVVRGNRMFRSVHWTDWNAWVTSTEQYLAVYDVETDEMIDLVEETRCPGLGNRVAADEDGNLYFSNWIWNVGETLVRGAPSSCALRIDAGAERFSDDWVLAFPDLTDGREAAMFTYLGDGQASLNVFHDERAEFDEMSDPAALASTQNWRLWSLDVEAETATPIEGLDWMNGGASTFFMDERAFVFLPGPDFSVTRIVEIEGTQAEPRFEVTGWSYQFVKVR